MTQASFPTGRNSTGELLPFYLPMGARHGLISGATGTGKTVTLQLLAESFARAGVAVFTADVKGDLAGIALPGSETPKIKSRLAELDLPPLEYAGAAVTFWDLAGVRGHPLRTTVSEIGPFLLARLLELNDTQAGVLTLAFRVADDQGLLLLDLKDLRALLNWVGENAAELRTQYGNVAPASIGAIQRGLLALEEAGAEQFLGEPALNLADIMRVDSNGQGVINVLDARTLISNPLLYSSFLLWLMSELFESLPEIGDTEKPKLVFFFDEAHLLFDNAAPALIDKIEQIVRLIRSRGVGVYFVTQNPLDVPDKILGQLGNRFQHALRAFTPRDQKAVRAAAETFRANPKIDTASTITELAVGEALVSLLDSAGVPGIVDRVRILPPRSRIGAITENEQSQIIARSNLQGRYDKAVDRESAYEVLKQRTHSSQKDSAATAQTPSESGSGRQRQSSAEAFIKSVVRTFGSQLGRQIFRGIFGSITRSK